MEELDSSGVLQLVGSRGPGEGLPGFAGRVTAAIGADRCVACRVQHRRTVPTGTRRSPSPTGSTTRTVNGHFITIRDISEQRALEDRLLFRAEHDDLTGLLNRSAFRGAHRRLARRRGASDRDLPRPR